MDKDKDYLLEQQPYIYREKVPNRNSPPAVLLRESYREGDQVKKRTLANLSQSFAKDRKKRTEDNLPVHSFRTLLEDLGTICLNIVKYTLESGKYVFEKITRPTELQQKALDLLGISSVCTH